MKTTEAQKKSKPDQVIVVRSAEGPLAPADARRTLSEAAWAGFHAARG